jgi:hypothetical protein
MRTKFEKIPDLFTIPIASAIFHKNCRDEVPKLLKGHQAIFIKEELNSFVFSLLSSRINAKWELSSKPPDLQLTTFQYIPCYWEK